MEIHDPRHLVQPDDLNPITRRLERLMNRTSVHDADFIVKTIVKSGKAGVSAGHMRNNEAIPLSIQCGKGGTRYRGGLSSPQFHVAQLFRELQNAPNSGLRIMAVSKRHTRTGQTRPKGQMVKTPKLKPGEFKLSPSLTASNKQPDTTSQPVKSDLQKRIWQMEADEDHISRLEAEIGAFRKEIAKIEDTIATNEKTIKELEPSAIKLKQLRKSLGIEKD